MAVLAVLLGLGFHFRYHLLWRLTAAWEGLNNVKALLAKPMPDAIAPKDWVRCRFGALQFDLPPAMAGNVMKRRPSSSVCLYRDGSKSAIVHLPEGTREGGELLKVMLKNLPQGQGLSRPRLRLAWWQTGSDDFRWTMSRSELRWHAWCIAMTRLGRPELDGWAETMLSGDFDGIVMFDASRHRAIFDWQATNKAVTGYIHFSDKSGNLDPEWVRCVCKSVKVVEEPQPQKRP
jgi:hypothetical protein